MKANFTDFCSVCDFIGYETGLEFDEDILNDMYASYLTTEENEYED
jgi:hypothetical protein